MAKRRDLGILASLPVGDTRKIDDHSTGLEGFSFDLNPNEFDQGPVLFTLIRNASGFHSFS